MTSSQEKLEAKLKELEQILGDWGYVVFLFDRKTDLNSSMNSEDIGLRDALTCITALIKKFNVDPVRLYSGVYAFWSKQSLSK